MCSLNKRLEMCLRVRGGGGYGLLLVEYWEFLLKFITWGGRFCSSRLIYLLTILLVQTTIYTKRNISRIHFVSRFSYFKVWQQDLCLLTQMLIIYYLTIFFWHRSRDWEEELKVEAIGFPKIYNILRERNNIFVDFN